MSMTGNDETREHEEDKSRTERLRRYYKRNDVGPHETDTMQVSRQEE